MRNQLVLLWRLCGTLAFLFCVSGAALEAPLIYEKLEVPFQMDGGLYFESLLKPFPGTDWKAPALVSERPLYLVFPLDGRLLIVDRERKEDGFYNRVYFDANGNRDLTDDTPVAGECNDSSQVPQATFRAIAFSAPVGGLNYGFDLRVSQVKPGSITSFIDRLAGGHGEEPTAAAKTACCYAADVEVEGAKYHIRLIDANMDGQFKAAASSGPASQEQTLDTIMVERVGESNEPTWQTLGSYLAIGQSVFKFLPDVAAGKLVISPVEGDTGRLKIADTFETLTLLKNAPPPAEFVMMYRPAGSLPLPCGAYTLVQYDLFAKDPSGALWVVSTKGQCQATRLTLEKDKEIDAPFGQPLTARAVADPTLHSGFFWRKYAALNLVAQGAGGEQLQRLPLKLDEGLFAAEKPPNYRVLRGDGEVVAQGAFRYG